MVEGELRCPGVHLSDDYPFLSQAEPEVWLVLDGRRVLARLRAAGPSWIHVFIDGPPPSDRRVPLTIVLRGADGGVIDGVAELMSSTRRDGRTILRLRFTNLSTSGRHELIGRFLGDILREGPTESPALGQSACYADAGALRAIHQHRHAQAPLREVPMSADAVVLSKPVLWRGDATSRAEIVQSTPTGRSLVVRRRGSPPSAWETVRLELDLGVGGEPRPVQLVGMVIGITPSTATDSVDIAVRLVRWSADSDRAAWSRWLRHQQYLDTVGPEADEAAVTRTVAPVTAPGPPT